MLLLLQKQFKLNLINHFKEQTHTSSQLFIVTLDQGCTTHFLGGPNLRAKTGMFHILKDVFMTKTS
jgi:hypothetical protein